MKNKKEIEIKIEGENWTKALNKAYKKKNKSVAIEGFRKGTAPYNVYIQKMGIETLYMDAIEFVMDDAFKEALKKTDINPVCEPTVDVTKIDDKELIIKFGIIGKPEVTIGEYKNLGIKKEKAKVTKEEVDNEIKNLQNQLAEIVPKEKGKVKKGDTAVIDFDGYVDNVALDGGKGENYPLEIGSNTFIPGFEEGIIGMSIGENKELNLKFPEDYVEDLKGKDVNFKVTVKEIKERIVPELGEEFYKDLGYEDIKTEEEFRKEVEAELIKRKEAEILDSYLDKCLEKAAENMKVQINEEIIDDEVHRMIHQFEEQLEMQKIKLETYMSVTGLTHEDLHKQMEPEATKRIKYRYLLEEIANIEKIDFSEKEVEEKAQEMAENYGISVDELIKAYGTMDIVKYDMKMHAALEIIKNNN